MSKKKKTPIKYNWIPINDDNVRHVWAKDAGKEVTVDPTYYANSGTPIDEETGDDLTYVRTEIRT